MLFFYFFEWEFESWGFVLIKCWLFSEIPILFAVTHAKVWVINLLVTIILFLNIILLLEINLNEDFQQANTLLLQHFNFCKNIVKLINLILWKLIKRILFDKLGVKLIFVMNLWKLLLYKSDKIILIKYKKLLFKVMDWDVF